MWAQLGYTDDVHSHKLDETLTWGLIPSGQKTQKGLPLFPRIEDDAKSVESNAAQTLEKNKAEIHSKMRLFIKEKYPEVEKCGWAKTGDMLFNGLDKGSEVYYFKIKKIRDKCASVVSEAALKQANGGGMNAIPNRIQSDLAAFIERNPIQPS
jgi:hypothetical protein